MAAWGLAGAPRRQGHGDFTLLRRQQLPLAQDQASEASGGQAEVNRLETAGSGAGASEEASRACLGTENAH